MKTIIVLLVLALLITGCSFMTTSSRNRIIRQKDYIENKEITKLEYYPRKTNYRLSLNWVKQTLVKEQSQGDSAIYFFYDILEVPFKSLNLNRKIVYVVNEKPFSVQIDSMWISNDVQMSENRQDILKSDSSKVSVVTGYSLKHEKNFYFTYRLPSFLIKQIAGAKRYHFYYSSPTGLIDVRPKRKSLRKIKKVISSQQKNSLTK